MVLLVTVMTLALVMLASPAWATTFTVNQTGDEDDLDFPGGTFDGSSDGVCDITLSMAGNQCTLRAAIQAANANDNAPTVDLISFNIPGDGPHVIAPASEELPAISEPVTIDGYTQGDLTSETTDDAKENTRASGTNADLRIEIRGASADPGSNGLTIGSSGTTIRGLVITRFQEDSTFVLGGSAIVFDISGERTTNNRVEGNFIGTNRTGTTAEPNEAFGVVNDSTSSGITIGGTTPASRNLISANAQSGVVLGSSDANTVRGNLIGTKANGADPLGNGFRAIFAGGDKNLISENVIAFNANDGVSIFDGVGTRILTNSIFSNTGLGINLSAGGREQDLKDPDTGANNRQNYPVISSATNSGTATTIKGTLNSKPRKTFTIQFFSNPVLTDQGRTYLGQANVKTNLRGKASFSFSGPEIDTGQQITATATGAEGTSEFSDAVSVGTAS
jgi:hypothetical protein